MKNIVKGQKGFAMIIVIFVLGLLSILGLAVLTTAMSNFNMTKLDSKSQGSYYIAEAGINHMVDKIRVEAEKNHDRYKMSDGFFQHMENKFLSDEEILDDFELNKGERPRALISVELLAANEEVRDYKIVSKGQIGDSQRTVSTIISIEWDAVKNIKPEGLLLNTNKFIFKGSNFNAPGKTIIISGQDEDSIGGGSHIKAKNIYFKQLESGIISGLSYGDSADPGDIYLQGNALILEEGRKMYGNVHTSGDFTVTGGVAIKGNLYVDGNFEASGGTHIDGDIYVNGNFKVEGCTVDGNVYASGGLDASGGGIIKGNLYIEGNLILSGGATIGGSVDLLGNIAADGGSKVGGILNVAGNAKLISVTLQSGANIDGDIELDWGPTLGGEVYYTGSLKWPDNFNKGILEKCILKESLPAVSIIEKPDYSFVIPDCVALLKSDSWYEDKGYEIKEGYISSEIPDDSKWLVDDYVNEKYQKMQGQVVIISKGDIILRGGNSFRGALIAPNGIVRYTGGDFQGVIVSNENISLSGWGPTNVVGLDEYFGSYNVPVDISCSNINDPGDGNNGDDSLGIRVFIKSGIKEE